MSKASRRRTRRAAKPVAPPPPSIADEVGQLVADLVDKYRPPAAVDHVCVVPAPPLGYPLGLGYDVTTFGQRHGCSHAGHDTASLLARLDDLVLPGTTPTESGGCSPSGSPAPWNASAAELLDEILRGAIDLAADVRHVLDMGPLDGAAGPIDDAGRTALRDLPGKMHLLEVTHKTHALMQGKLINEKKPDRGHHPGRVESTLRRWHTAALRVCGFDPPTPAWLQQMDNPMTLDEREDFRRLGWCGDRLRYQQIRCGHQLCLLGAYAAMGDRAPLWCPQCWQRGLQVDPSTGQVTCPRPECVDEDGDRHVWQSAEFALRVIEAYVRAELGLS